MHIIGKAPKRRSVAAKRLEDSRYRHRVVRDKTKYTRKGRSSSMRQSRTLLSPSHTVIGLQSSLKQRNFAHCLGGHHDDHSFRRPHHGHRH